MEIRTRVFVDEQQVPVELEQDEMDPQCLHIKALAKSGEIVGTARLLPNHYIGRMCVLKSYRNRGIGAKMLSFLIALAKKKGFTSLYLNGQLSALAFYEKQGFRADSEVFLEAGIEHQHMSLNLL